ncbi:hypothetical protein D3C75_949210 [compost metagenome]
MAAGVGGGVIQEHVSVIPGNQAVNEHDIGDIADPFLTFGRDQMARRSMQQLGGICRIRQEGIDHITQSRRGIAHPVGDVQPALGGFDGGRALAVFDFLNGMVIAAVDNGFGGDNGGIHAFRQTPSDAASGACVDEAVLGTGVESIFAVYKLRV